LTELQNNSIDEEEADFLSELAKSSANDQLRAAQVYEEMLLEGEKEKTVPVTDITEQERLARIDTVMGMFAHLPGSVENFIKEKQKDIEIENRRWKEEQ